MDDSVKTRPLVSADTCEQRVMKRRDAGVILDPGLSRELSAGNQTHGL